jgi:hypothetical protein
MPGRGNWCCIAGAGAENNRLARPRRKRDPSAASAACPRLVTTASSRAAHQEICHEPSWGDTAGRR